MHSSSTLATALASVWQRTGAEAGIPVSFVTLAREWSDAGLRLSDLRDAVRELIEKGHARARERQGHLAVELTQAGWLQTQPK